MEKKHLLIGLTCALGVVSAIFISLFVWKSVTSNEKLHFVTFDSHNGTHIATQRVKEGGVVKEPEAPKRGDDIFKGWFIDDIKFENAYTFGTPVHKDLTLYAKWEGGPLPGNAHRVTWLNYDGSTLKEEIYDEGDDPVYEDTTHKTPTKDSDAFYDYDFDYWYPSISKVYGDQTYVANYKTAKVYPNTKAFMKVNISEEDKTFSFLFYSSTGIVVNWDDGSQEETIAERDATHTYTTAGEYNIRIRNEVANLNLRENKKVEKLYLGDTITSINDGDFSGCSSLTSVNISEGVSSIEENAFYNCSNLTSINIPDSVTTIDFNAFSGCSSLKSINIPRSVVSIGDGTFNGCSSLSTIVVDSSNTVYDSRENCNAIIRKSDNTLIVGCQNTVIPSSVTSINDEAFEGCSGLTSINIPRSVVSIGGGTFNGCSSLSTIVVDSSNTVYDSRENCNAIIRKSDNTLIVGCQNTVIPASVVSIGVNAFSGHSNLTSISIPNNITSIGMTAFCNCSNLTSINIPDSVTTIGYGAFEGCSGLTSINIPRSVTSIPANVFVNCSSLSTIVVDSSNTVYDSRENCNAIIRKSDNTLIVGCQNTVIPSSVTTIGERAFSGCSNLKSIDITNGVVSIHNRAFLNCSSLISTSIPTSVTFIGPQAFDNCPNLEKVDLMTFTKNSSIPTLQVSGVFSNNSKFYVVSEEMANKFATSGKNWPDDINRYVWPQL